MADGTLLDLWRACLSTTTLVAAPFVIAALAVGLLAALVQAATQLQENALSFVPKVVGVGALLALVGPWALSQLVRYAETSIEAIATLGQGAGR